MWVSQIVLSLRLRLVIVKMLFRYVLQLERSGRRGKKSTDKQGEKSLLSSGAGLDGRLQGGRDGRAITTFNPTFAPTDVDLAPVRDRATSASPRYAQEPNEVFGQDDQASYPEHPLYVMKRLSPMCE